jgi:hypothetical protein
MPEFSSLLRQRLGAASAPPVHPDADTLTAYAEDLLSAAERSQVIQHLSLCADCRDVAALILPEGVPAQQPEPAVAAATVLAVPRRNWFRMPSFGLAAAVAAVIALVALLVELPKQHFTGSQSASVQQNAPKQQEEAKIVPPAPPAPAEAAPEANSAADHNGYVARSEAPAGTSELSGTRKNSQENKKTAGLIAGNVMPPPRPPAASVAEPVVTAQNAPLQINAAARKDYVNSQVFATQANLISPSPAQLADLPSAPAAARPKFVLGTPVLAGGLQKGAPLDAAGAAPGTTTIYALSPAAHQSFSITGKISQVGRQLHLKRVVPAIPSESVNSYAMFTPELANSQPSEMAARAPEKTDTADLNQSQAFTTRAMSRSALSALDQQSTLLWKVAEGKLLKSADMNHWTSGYTGPDSINFTVVTANGPEIWAGGSNAALVHSHDGGITWERITLGASATSAITSVQVNRNRVQVQSSSGQSWSSHDGGKSWSMDN